MPKRIAIKWNPDWIIYAYFEQYPETSNIILNISNWDDFDGFTMDTVPILDRNGEGIVSEYIGARDIEVEIHTGNVSNSKISYNDLKLTMFDKRNVEISLETYSSSFDDSNLTKKEVLNGRLTKAGWNQSGDYATITLNIKCLDPFKVYYENGENKGRFL